MKEMGLKRILKPDIGIFMRPMKKYKNSNRIIEKSPQIQIIV